ncbi:MAG TPA: putative nucleotidyltransferase substrate binding domain-containing protein [Xanthomonadales bacterium]|nr:putative nucleotidyltransferase substrate binding domain-containing protein [Xanthomonadales bacterium]
MSISPELSEVVDFLKVHAPFDRLRPALLEDAARQIEIIYRRKGDVLLRIGQANAALAVIRRGAVEVHDADGRLVFQLAEGESYGLPSLLTGKPVRNRVTLIEDGLIYLLPVAEFRALCAADAGFDQFYVRTLEERLRGAAENPAGNAMLATAVGKLAGRAPVMIGPQASIREAAKLMSVHNVSSILIGDGEQMLGIVTDRDLRNRVLAVDRDPAAPVLEIMTADPASLDVGRPVFEAYLAMVNRGIHHLPLTQGGRPVGMITTRDLVSLQTQHPLYLVRQVYKQDSVAALQEVASRVPQMYALLLGSGASPEDVARMLSALTDAFTRRLLQLAQARLGPPPLAFAWICFGSQARSEQGPQTDQDNGLILAQMPDASAASYFEALALEVCDGLNACGYPWCSGDIMARNPAWRMSLEAWAACFRGWINTATSQALMHASVFFDQRLVAGDRGLFESLQAAVFEQAAAHPMFLAVLAKQAVGYEVPLGLFRRFVVAREGEHRDTLDLKAAGAMPLTDVLRVHALAAGVREPGCLQRIDALRQAGRLTPESAAELGAAFRLILRLRLEHQAEQLSAGQAPDNRINPDRLERRDRDALRDAFGVIRIAQTALGNEYAVR